MLDTRPCHLAVEPLRDSLHRAELLEEGPAVLRPEVILDRLQGLPHVGAFGVEGHHGRRAQAFGASITAYYLESEAPWSGVSGSGWDRIIIIYSLPCCATECTLAAMYRPKKFLATMSRKLNATFFCAGAMTYAAP